MQVQGYRIHSWGAPLAPEEWALGEPGPGEVLVKVEACGIGLTVLNCIRGDLSNTAPLPRVPGHELVGRVVATGSGVSEGLVGRRIVGYFYLACGSCAACRSGHDPHCARLAGWLGVHRDGGYATHTIIPAINALPVPDELDPIQATAVPDAIATPLHVCKTRLALTPLDRVVVIGAGGGVGIHMVQMARLFGASVCGLETREDKFDGIRAAGGEPASSHDWQSITLPAEWRGAAPTAVINLVGTPASFRWSFDALGMGGSLVVLTTFHNVAMDMDPRTLVFREIRVLGSRYASRAEVMEAAELVASGRIRPVVSHVVQPHEIEAVHEELRQGQLLGRGAVRWTAD